MGAELLIWRALTREAQDYFNRHQADRGRTLGHR